MNVTKVGENTRQKNIFKHLDHSFHRNLFYCSMNNSLFDSFDSIRFDSIRFLSQFRVWDDGKECMRSCVVACVCVLVACCLCVGGGY